MSLRPPGRIHRAVLAPLPVASSGITTCPNQTIDTTGLVRASPLLTCRCASRYCLRPRGGTQRSSSGLQPFVYLQAPILAWPTGCTDRQGTMSLRPPGRIHRAVLAPLPVTSSGITTCPNQTIDTTGLVRASPSLTCWNRSLVGCSFTLHLDALAYSPQAIAFGQLHFRAVD